MDPATPVDIARPPARWLVAALIVVLGGASLLASIWASREREAGKPAVLSGEPGFKAEFLADPAGKLTFDQVLAHSDGFSPWTAASGTRHLPLVWYRLTVSNPDNAVDRAILGVSDDFLQKAELFQAGHPVEQTGGFLRWHDRAVSAQRPAFSIDLPAASETVFYVRIDDFVRQPQSFLLWRDQHVFDRTNQLSIIQYVGYFSLWIALVSYNGFLYAILRRRDYQLYLYYVVCMGALVFVASDLITLIMPWGRWALRGTVIAIALNLTTFNLVRFTRVFLETKVWAPTWDRWIKAGGWAVLASSLALPFWMSPAHVVLIVPVTFALNMLVLACLPIVGAILLFRGNPQSGLYVLAFLPQIGALIYVIKLNVSLPDGRANGIGALCANAFELIILALALAWRYRRITDESERQAIEYTARLEEDVAKRTRELRDTNDSLARANRDKDRVFGIIAHDLRGPSQSLFTLANLLTANPGMLSPQETSSLARDIEEVCQAQLSLLDNLLQWGRMQSGQALFHPSEEAAIDIVNSAAAALAHIARNKGIQLFIDAAPDLTVFADPQAIQAILRNLLSNALKFTSSGGHVSVMSRSAGNRTELVVEDNGTGIQPQRLAEVLAGPVSSLAGTQSEKGAGIGLSLCFDLAKANGGELHISSGSGRGTMAVLSLPPARS